MRVKNKRSNSLNQTNTGPKIPDTNSIDFGEIAINYKKGNESIFIKNDANEIILFTPPIVRNDVNPFSYFKGPGRPDKSNTIGDTLKGKTLVNGDRYISTDGANVGAWEWEYRNGSWTLFRGDTGWRALGNHANKTSYNGEIYVRRINNNVIIEFAGNSYGTITINQMDKFAQIRSGGQDGSYRINLYQLPTGYIPYANAVNQMFKEPEYKSYGLITVHGKRDQNGIIMACFNRDVPRNQVNTLLRVGLVSFITSDPWPDTLLGTEFIP